MALGRPYPRSRRSVLSEVGCLCKYLNLGALHRYFELYNAFGFSYLIAYTTIVSLGRTVNTNANVFRIGLGSFRLHVRRIEGAVFAVHLIWLEAPLVQADLTINVVGGTLTVVRYAEDDGRLDVL